MKQCPSDQILAHYKSPKMMPCIKILPSLHANAKEKTCYDTQKTEAYKPEVEEGIKESSGTAPL